jgi:hypothetical protein
MRTARRRPVPSRRAAIAGALSLTLLAARSGAQAQVVQGPNLGSTVVAPAGDVDDDGFADLLVQLAATWEVRSGATGLPLPSLGRARAAGTHYAGLLADLDVDGHDDLGFIDPANGLVELRSGRDGALLFAFTDPLARSVGGAEDHDADGADDVMVQLEDGVNAVRTYVVLSGRGGAVIASYQVPAQATSNGVMHWVGDVDGDGFTDLRRETRSFGQPFSIVTAGPDHVRQILSAVAWTERACDTDADGRDELWLNGDLVDAVSGLVVWAGAPRFVWPAFDLDGDGAEDLVDFSPILSGRTHAAFPGAQPVGFVQSVGDVDGDGRDECVCSGDLFELVGGPASSSVRDRGAAGRTVSGSRPRIRHRLRPRLGDAMLVDLFGAGATNLAFLAIGPATDIDLAPLGAPGNRAYVQPITAMSQFADAHGHARRALAVPNAAPLLGLALALQWAVFEPAANPLGVATSNALDFVVGS